MHRPFSLWPEALLQSNQGPISRTIFRSQFKFDEIGFSVTPLYGIISLQNFARATTAQLSCHMQNFISMTSLQLEWEQKQISIEFELRLKKSFVKWAPRVVYELWTQAFATSRVSYPRDRTSYQRIGLVLRVCGYARMIRLWRVLPS